ncbi:MAG TPA: hypothetical protein VJ224_04000 [Thermoplasmata archaeon]|nr:hypothetical protein [Thermoplasmata archaeon]
MYRNSLRFGLRVEDRITMTDKRAEPRTSASRLLWRTLTVVVVLATVVAGIVWGFLALRAPSETSGADQTRSDGGSNGVTFAATLEAIEPRLTFTVELDTHTVNLAAYDLSNIVLEDTDGTSFDATEVTVLQRTAHHLEAVLVFPSTGSRSVTLIARDLASVPERRLVFDL